MSGRGRSNPPTTRAIASTVADMIEAGCAELRRAPGPVPVLHRLLVAVTAATRDIHTAQAAERRWRRNDERTP